MSNLISFGNLNPVSLIVSYVVNSLWQVPLVGAAGWAVSRLLKRLGPQAQHVVWVVTLGLAVLTPAVPRWHLPAPAADVSSVVTVVDDGAFPAPPIGDVSGGGSTWWEAEMGVATLPAGLVFALLLGYLSALLYFAVRFGWSLYRVGSLQREGEPLCFDAESQEVWNRCKKSFSLGEIRTLLSQEIVGPVTIGFSAPVLLVPAGFFERCSAHDLLATLGHECAHIQRRDFQKNLMYEAASLLIAFHPLTWMLKRQIAQTREMICDGAAVGKLIDVPHYVQALLRLATMISVTPQVSPAIGIFDGNILEKRIMTMKTKRQRVGFAGRFGLIAAGALVMFGVASVGAMRAVAVEARSPIAVKAAAASAFRAMVEASPAPVAKMLRTAAGPLQGQMSANANLPDKQLYDKGIAASEAGHFDVARLDLQTLLNTYPDTQYQMRAKLAIADSWYKQGGPAALYQAESEYKDFLTFFPNVPEAAEARVRLTAIAQTQAALPQATAPSQAAADDAARLRLLTAQIGERQDLTNNLNGTYKKWVDEDTRWIITDQELAAFKALSTDEERDKFIESFWQRRNPTPGSKENPYRVAYYQRIAYANERFATTGTPGWKTDRGHIYIAYGKPDSTDDHPASGGDGRTTATYPFMVWHYRSLPGIGDNIDIEFVDTCRCGEYHMTIDRLEKVAMSQGKEFDRLETFTKLLTPPPVQSRDLEEYMGSSKVLTGPVFSFEVRLGYVKGANETVTASLTIQIRNKDVTFSTKGGLAAGNVNILGRVSDMAHKPVLTFEDTVKVVETPNGMSVFRKSLSLPQGHYRMDIVLKDANRPDHIGKFSSDVNVPKYDDPQVGASSQGQVDARAEQALNRLAQANSAMGNGPVRVSGGVVAGACVSCPDPAYPPVAKAAHVQGAVVMHAIIAKDGTVRDLNVISGPQMLQQAAQEAVRTWRYKPYMLGGDPTEVDTTVTVNFSMTGMHPVPTCDPSVSDCGIGSAPPPPPQAETLPTGVRHVGGGVSAPVVIYMAQPEYTEAARAAKFSGNVIVALLVDAHGLPQQVHVVRAAGMGLDEEAVKVVKQYKFKPAMENGVPVSVEVDIEVNFQAADTAPQAAAPSQGQPAAPNGPVRVSGGVMAGSKISGEYPLYPSVARAAHIEGAVVLHAIISKTGTVEKLDALSGPEFLRNPARDAVKDWRYKPYLLGGAPVEVETTVTVDFRMTAAVQQPSTPDNVRHIGDGVVPPVVISQVEPEFTAEARAAKYAGNIQVSLIVDKQGRPTQVHVVRGAGMGLDEKAVEAVKQYKFKPGTEKGKPVLVALNIEVNFQIF